MKFLLELCEDMSLFGCKGREVGVHAAELSGLGMERVWAKHELQHGFVQTQATSLNKRDSANFSHSTQRQRYEPNTSFRL